MTKKTITIDPRGEQMLELLSRGASARVIAKKLGYSEGTMRVYLHNLYRVIGVRNKTEAVIWHLNRAHAEEPRALAPPPPPPPQGSGDDIVGAMALGEDLYTALGVMSAFVGPYGLVWEAAQRIKGVAFDETLLARRAQSRLLWRALLKGDFAYGKMLSDEGGAERIAFDSPSDAVVLGCLLAIGGYSGAAERLASRLLQKRKAAAPITSREAELLRAVRQALDGRVDAMRELQELAAEGARNGTLRHVALASLFHACRAAKDAEHARAAAGALWAEAEASRQQLEAMGLRPLTRESSVKPAVRAKEQSKEQSKEKAAAIR